jgi:hypothetical protein
MANIELSSVNLPRPTGGTPSIELNAAGDTLECDCPTDIVASGTATLVGVPFEPVGGWALGYIQLKFIGTNYAIYRGRTEREGSILVNNSNQILCRDTDETTPELWYDPIAWGIHGTRGTRQLNPAATLPNTGRLAITSGLSDGPRRRFATQRMNARTGRTNFLYKIQTELHFCTILTAFEPGRNRYLPLKHFYWNVLWTAHLGVNAAGASTITRRDLMQMNIQNRVHSGVPDDKRFKDKVLDATLPISNNVSRRAPRVTESANYSV